MGVSGFVSEANSLVGTNPGSPANTLSGDEVGSGDITPLSNGNYVVASDRWNGGYENGRGAVTWGNGSTGVSGVVSEANSLVGSYARDRVGGVTPLSNGNYVVVSPGWNGGFPNGRGAVTWGNGSTGVSGTVDACNSLVGSNPNDDVGSIAPNDDLGSGVTALSNGNYVVASRYWNGGRGAVTWGSGTAGVSGPVDASNSLVGSNPGDSVGEHGVAALSNGNYLVGSPGWNGGRGA